MESTDHEQDLLARTKAIQLLIRNLARAYDRTSSVRIVLIDVAVAAGFWSEHDGVLSALYDLSPRTTEARTILLSLLGTVEQCVESLSARPAAELAMTICERLETTVDSINKILDVHEDRIDMVPSEPLNEVDIDRAPVRRSQSLSALENTIKHLPHVDADRRRSLQEDLLVRLLEEREQWTDILTLRDLTVDDYESSDDHAASTDARLSMRSPAFARHPVPITSDDPPPVDDAQESRRAAVQIFAQSPFIREYELAGSDPQLLSTTDDANADSPPAYETLYRYNELAEYEAENSDEGFYQYRPLAEDEVRLVVLEPGEHNAPVKCRIETWRAAVLAGSGSTKVQYEALSWSWPKTIAEEDNKVVELGTPALRKTMSIPGQLYGALVHLRFDGYKERRLWVDYICINQLDVTERNNQVARMAEVYANAMNVCIWLGPASGSTDTAFDFVAEVKSSAVEFDAFVKEEYLRRFLALRDLMNRPWFIRRWVVQEIALATRATMHCQSMTQKIKQSTGEAPGRSMDWQDFAAVVSLWNDSNGIKIGVRKLAMRSAITGYNPFAFDDIDAWGASKLISTITRLRWTTGPLRQTTTLTDLVGSLAMFKTSEPRDTIYALLALVQKIKPHDGQYTINQHRTLTAIPAMRSFARRQYYPVNYEQPVLAVYQQFMQYSISEIDATRALDIICQPFAQEFTKGDDIKHDSKRFIALQDPNALVHLPSWMASSRKNPVANLWPIMHFRRWENNSDSWQYPRGHTGTPFVSMSDVIGYQAAGSIPCNKRQIRFRQRSDHYSMYVEGFLLDVIETDPPPASLLGNIPLGWLPQLQRKAEQEDDPDVVWRTLVANRSSTDHPIYFYKLLLEKLLATVVDDDEGFDTPARAHDSVSSSQVAVLDRLRATIKGRTLVLTSSRPQGLVGLAPGGTEQGDYICIMYGCTVPVIVRRRAKTPGQLRREINEDRMDLEDRVQQLTRNYVFVAKLRMVQLQARERVRRRRESSDQDADQRPSERQGRTVMDTFKESIPLRRALSSLATNRPSQDPPKPPVHVLTWQPRVFGAVLIAAMGIEYQVGYPMLLVFLGLLCLPRVLRGCKQLMSSADEWLSSRSTSINDDSAAFLSSVPASLLALASSRTLLESLWKISFILLVMFLFDQLSPMMEEADFLANFRFLPLRQDMLSPTLTDDPNDLATKASKVEQAPFVSSHDAPATLTGNSSRYSAFLESKVDRSRANSKVSEELESAPPYSPAPPVRPYMSMTLAEAIEIMKRKRISRMEKMEGDRGYYYEVIGDCYIDKMMDGEAIERLSRRGDFVDAKKPEYNRLLKNSILELR